MLSSLRTASESSGARKGHQTHSIFRQGYSLTIVPAGKDSLPTSLDLLINDDLQGNQLDSSFITFIRYPKAHLIRGTMMYVQWSQNSVYHTLRRLFIDTRRRVPKRICDATEFVGMLQIVAMPLRATLQSSKVIPQSIRH